VQGFEDHYSREDFLSKFKFRCLITETDSHYVLDMILFVTRFMKLLQTPQTTPFLFTVDNKNLVTSSAVTSDSFDVDVTNPVLAYSVVIR